MAFPRHVDIEGVKGQCPICQHAPIQHVPDGTGYSCLVCVFQAAQALENTLNGQVVTPPKICTLKFQFKLSRHEREQAMVAAKDSYPPHTNCTECDCEWQQHKGYLCPTGDSTFVPVIESDLPFIHTH